MVVRYGVGSVRLAALAFAAAWALALSPAAAAAEGEEVAVGGYLDLFGGGAGGGALTLTPRAAPPLGTGLGRLAVTDAGPRTTLTYFTPRLSGFELGLGFTPRADADQQTAAAGHLPGEAGAEDGLAVGGGLRLGALGLGLPAAHAQGGGLGDGSAGLVTAGVGYGFGPLNTNVTYGFTTSTVDRGEIDLLAVSADMDVVPGVAVTGGVAVSAEEETGDRAAAGMVGIRLNF